MLFRTSCKKDEKRGPPRCHGLTAPGGKSIEKIPFAECPPGARMAVFASLARQRLSSGANMSSSTRLFSQVFFGSLGIGLALIGTGSSPAQAAAAPEIVIRDGVLQPPRYPHPAGTPGDRLAGFFVLQNNGMTDQLLEGITSPFCQQVTVNHSNQEAQETGDPSLDIFHHLAIPHQATLVFPHEGYHLLCYGYRKDLRSGAEVPFIFHFRGRPDVTASFRLAAEASSAPAPASSKTQ
ncbi:copper chaperone PCu(A)C [Oecophyllibacter saccharovorans]|nr:copper chaperone PCu(A)C [Oecophyllibacter saccharovorans]TPW34695.1 copper chaperone PCu(A)C [Oecophyllibacter saccharovorans]